MASQVHIQRTQFMQQEVGLNCQRKSRSRRSPLTKSRVESREGSKVESIDRSSRSAIVLDRSCSSTRSISGSTVNTQHFIQIHAFLSNLANRQTDRQTDRETNERGYKRICLHPSSELRVFRHLWSRSDAPCSSTLHGYSHLPQAKTWASLGSPAALPEVAGNLRCRKAPLWTFDYHMEKSASFYDVTPGL